MRCRLLLTLMFATLASCSSGQESRLTVKPDPQDASRFLCDVKFETFTTPKGWRPNRSDKNSYAILTKHNETYPKVSQMITIDIGKAVAPNAETLATSFAKTWGGTVDTETVKVDGETGYRVKVPSDGKSLRPIDCIAIVKEGRAFLLIAGATNADGLAQVLDDLVLSWKWKK